MQAAYAIAGLGLFLSGLHMLSDSMQALAGRRARRMLARMTRGPVSAASAGLLLGAMTQSTGAAAFICIGLLETGALSLSGALTMSAWASVGTSLLVFLASVDVLLLGLLAAGMVGLARLLNLGRYQGAGPLIAVALATGLLLIGLGLIKSSSHALQASPWAIEFLEFSGENPVIALLVGVIVTLIVQSSATISVLAVTLNLAGILPLTEALLLVCGASIGSGLSVVLITSHLAGMPRRLALWQCIVKVLGAAVVLPLVILLPGETSAPGAVLGTEIPIATLIAVVYLLLQVGGALAAGLLQSRIMQRLEQWVPERGARGRFAVRHIYAEAARYPETALLLAEREQQTLIAELPATLDPLRPDEVDPDDILGNDERHAAAGQLARQIGEFITEAMTHGHTETNAGTVFALQSRNETLRSLQDALHAFVQVLADLPRSGLALSMVESLHLLLLLLADTLGNTDDHSATLQELTTDRSEMMNHIRQSLLNNTTEADDRQALLLATGIFERAVWLVRHLALAAGPAR